MGRKRGQIEPLRSGALRVRVYVGKDPVGGQRLYLDEIIPADAPRKEKLAEQALTRLLNRVDEQRTPRTRASVGKLLDDFMKVADLTVGTRRGWTSKIENHIRPLVGNLTLNKVGTVGVGGCGSAACRGARIVQGLQLLPVGPPHGLRLVHQGA